MWTQSNSGNKHFLFQEVQKKFGMRSATSFLHSALSREPDPSASYFLKISSILASLKSEKPSSLMRAFDSAKS